MNLRQKKKQFKKTYGYNPPKWLKLNKQTLDPEYLKTAFIELTKCIVEISQIIIKMHIEAIKERIRIRNLETVNKALTRRNHERRKEYHW